MTKPLNLIILFSILSIALMGCSPIVRPEQLVNNESVPLGDEALIGQTFFARYRGLSGIEVYLKPNRAETGELALTLFNNPQKQEVLAKSKLPAEMITRPGYYRFDFPAIENSTNRDYYIEISAQGANAPQIGAGPGEAYLDGALYQNNIPQDKQLAFQLAYDPYQLALGLGSLGFTWLGIMILAAFLFILPGWAVLGFWEAEWKLRSWGEKLGLSAGVSLAIYPLVFLWTDVINLQLGSLYAWLPATLALGAIVWRNRGWRSKLAEFWRRDKVKEWLYAYDASDFALIILLSLILTTRFWVIRNLELPLWGDSYHHTVIAQLLVDNQGLFNSWEPYAELQTFTYHFGFHALVAVFHWITSLPLPQATLWTGQILNSLAILALYPLAVKIGKNRWTGIFAVLIAGLLSPMPMYYVNWGRYTQLAGQVILPVVAFILWRIFERGPKDWGSIVLTWILMGGLALTHYRVLIFAIIFLIVVFLFNLSTKNNLKSFLKRTLLSAAGAIMLFLPWFIHVFGGKIYQALVTQITTPANDLSEFSLQYNAIGDLLFYLPAIFWVLLPFAAGWALWRRDRNIAIISVWWLLIFLAANPQWFQLPGSGTLSNFALFMAAYIPVSLILGCSLVWLSELIFPGAPRKLERAASKRWLNYLVFPTLIFLFLTTSLAGARQRVHDLNLTYHALATRPDIRAASWIQDNMPQEARFLVNSFFAYGNSLVVGSDGGWWLPLLSMRGTSLPPINYASELGPRENYLQSINKIVAEIQDNGLDDATMLRLLRRRGISHIYIGQRQGSVNTSQPLLDLDRIQDNRNFRLIYNQDRVRIFEIVY